MLLPVNVKLTSNGVGQWLAAAEEINGYIIINGCYRNLIQHHIVGTGLAPVRNKFHIKSNSRTTARVVPTVVDVF